MRLAASRSALRSSGQLYRSMTCPALRFRTITRCLATFWYTIATTCSEERPTVSLAASKNPRCVGGDMFIFCGAAASRRSDDGGETRGGRGTPNADEEGGGATHAAWNVRASVFFPRGAQDAADGIEGRGVDGGGACGNRADEGGLYAPASWLCCMPQSSRTVTVRSAKRGWLFNLQADPPFRRPCRRRRQSTIQQSPVRRRELYVGTNNFLRRCTRLIGVTH